MNKVYNDNLGGEYTSEAIELEGKIRKLLKPIIREEIDKGTSPEAIQYVLFNGIYAEILYQRIFARAGRDLDGKIN